MEKFIRRKILISQNIGSSQEIPDLEKNIFEKISANEESKKIDTHHYLFQWNTCANKPNYGRSAAEIRFSENFLHIAFVGRTLSQPTPWTLPNCTTGLNQVFLKLSCSSEVYNLHIAYSLGLNWIEPPFAAQTFLAPFSKTIENPCKEKIDRLEVGWKSSKIDNNGRVEPLQSESLVWKN